MLDKLKNIVSFFRPLATLGLLIYIGSKIDFGTVFSIMKQSDLKYIASGVVCYNVAIWFEAFRFYVVMNQFEQKIPYIEILHIQYVSMFYGTFIPIGMISSEIVRGYKFSQQGYSGKKAAAIIIILKTIGLYVLLGSAALSILELKDTRYYHFSIALAGLFVVATIVTLTIICSTHCIDLFISLNKKMNIHRMNLSGNIDKLLLTIRMMVVERKKKIITVLGLTSIGYLFSIFGNLLFAQSLGMDVTLLKMGWVNGLTGISMLLPLGLFSFGGKDLTYWYLFKSLGFDMNQIGAFLFLINAGYIMNAAIGGFWELYRLISAKLLNR